MITSAAAVLALLTALPRAPLALPAAPPSPRCADAAAWRHVILDHRARYPEMAVADLYKLLHQGALGSEHAVKSTAAARRWLEEELATMGEGPEEPLVDTIAPGGRHVRIHLRPYVLRGGDPEVLLEAFVATANGSTGSVEALECALSAALSLADEGRLPWPAELLQRRFAAWREAGFPAEHHSRGYVPRYRPAYRVIAGGRVEGVLATLSEGAPGPPRRSIPGIPHPPQPYPAGLPLSRAMTTGLWPYGR